MSAPDRTIEIPMQLAQRIGSLLERLRALPDGCTVSDVVQILMALEACAQQKKAEAEDG